MEGFQNWAWDLILPGCGGTSAFSRGETLAARPAPPRWTMATTSETGARKTLRYYVGRSKNIPRLTRAAIGILSRSPLQSSTRKSSFDFTSMAVVMLFRDDSCHDRYVPLLR